MEVVLDSGSTYTYLPGDLYTQLKASLSKSLKQVSDASLPLCWKGPRPFKSVDDLKKEFKPKVSLKFGSGVTMAIPHENYLVITIVFGRGERIHHASLPCGRVEDERRQLQGRIRQAGRPCGREGRAPRGVRAGAPPAACGSSRSAAAACRSRVLPRRA
ncbi:aspartic proteinase Asp1-like [Panicum miliaceum]|uniref:Aspartic proteinase Asp1-like n=1 Tax=Panicum miliaceum TaxID=4540 RepID=A0A3L6PKK2_PANMI|nr:aspartic proteinase Asp1-like [Panicum miliaceum]